MKKYIDILMARTILFSGLLYGQCSRQWDFFLNQTECYILMVID